ncbi:galactosyltransferase-domain-containing protein [Mucor mucedo]|uniref:galactosyltransferase-domain-containing protein n=1 Tax=Mucor mucedo TaxID=29922 RepID=UPI00221E7D53|nr:galactosyltransferase-domain-containing protein [Mucor mucedo]KAI7875735.1 galactosyltransferase-domain-containing protein [Mucor mucedo]
MAQKNTLPFFRQKRILSSLNVPRRYEIPVSILRALSCVPAALNIIHNLKASWQVPERDAGGPLTIQTTQAEYYVAILWCILAGYWSWILATSMMKRWLYHYEIKHAIIRLLTLIVVTWCLTGIIGSIIDASDPIRIQMTICFILLFLNFLKLTFASSTKYSQKIEDVLPTTRFNLKSTAVKILLLPLLIVMGLSGFALTGQVNRLQYNSILLMNNQPPFELDSTVSPITGGITILVLILSSWTSQSAEKRQILRDTTLHWTEKTSDTNIIYRFVVGQPPSPRIQSWMGPKLLAESEKYHDLLVVPAPDLQLDKSKKLFEAFKWASSSVRHDYLVKTDDDVFVRFDVLRKELVELGSPKSNYWNGFVYRNMPIDYFKPSYNMDHDYAMPVLPAFTSGTLYTISSDIVDRIAKIEHPQRFVSRDDVNLAMWLFGFDIEPTHDIRIQDSADACEESMIAKRFPYDKFDKSMKLIYKNTEHRQPQCFGLNKKKKCAVCYPCHGKSDNWRSSNLHCDLERGVSLRENQAYKKISGPVVKDTLPSSVIGVNDQWIIKDILSARSSIYTEDEENWHLLYWVCWTSGPETFTDRHWRAIEMVWVHEPNAVIIMMSNSLPENFFNEYLARGYNIQLVNFTKENLLKWDWYFGPGTKDWIQDWEKWDGGQYFNYHLTDYIRCILLYKYGGTYMDMDALWIRIPPNSNQEFIGSDYSNNYDDRAWTLDDKGLYLPQGLMRFKRGWKLFREMAEGAFDSFIYDPDCFNCGGPKAITSYVRERRAVLEEGGLTILPRKVLYPYGYNEIHKLLEPNALAEQDVKNKIEPFSWNIHLFGKMTNNKPVQAGSAIDFVFRKFDLNIPHRGTKTHSIISSTGTYDVPMRLVGPRDYLYHSISERMLEDDKKHDNLLVLQPVPGKFQGLNVIFVRGGPNKISKVTLQVEASIGRGRINNGTYEKKTRLELQDVTMREVNSVLNTLEYSPTKLMMANGGRDRFTVDLTFEHDAKVEKDQVQITVVVVEPVEEDDPLEED